MSLFAFLPALLRTGLAASVLPTNAECQQSTAPMLLLNPSPPATAFRHSGVVNSLQRLAQGAGQADATRPAKITKYTTKHPAPTISKPPC
ncbi:hypothetical protein SAMN04488069_10211 [Hymenobacter psychrophilus]|uniref:Secreted protein n=1 Tax=Hymenobacter psychrophilus TaxID=651662 RepID=A0A1H3CKR1_9BACT|nr:hypothetical protein SAMN04488069_10211 [Hymenobacter psychrophilus]